MADNVSTRRLRAPTIARPISGRRAWLALSFVLFALLALALLPWIMQSWMSGIRREIRAVAEPARLLASEVQIGLARELSALLRFHVLEREQFLGDYREAVSAQRQALEQLAPLARELGPEIAGPVAALQADAARWHRSLAEADLFRRQVSAPVFVQRLFERYPLYEAVVAQANEVQEAVLRATDERRAAMAEAERLQLILTIVLVLVALGAALAVFWLAWSLRALAARLERYAGEEVALRQAAQALTVAVQAKDVMSPIARGAIAATEADGAYVEQIICEGGEVEVVAISGRGVPPLGLRTPYPGSLTEEIIKSGEAELLTEIRPIGESMARYLVESCSRCSGLVVPLVSDQETLGALVLLRGPERPYFTQDEVIRARTLGNLASVALGRLRFLARQHEARLEAEAAVRARDDVLAIVSHDLRNPLGTVSTSASLLVETPLSEEQKAKQLEIIKRSAERMNGLIQDMLDVARIESGQALSLEPQAEKVAPLVNEACEAFETQAQERSQRLECEVPEGIPEVQADHDRILQVLSNLIGNAIKFTPEDGRIAVRAERHADSVRFSVSDTGRGIAEDDLPNLFLPYWQAKRKDRERRAGAGLGLPIARGIVEGHGGTIWAESREGQGSTFFFTLPLAESERGTGLAAAD